MVIRLLGLLLIAAGLAAGLYVGYQWWLRLGQYASWSEWVAALVASANAGPLPGKNPNDLWAMLLLSIVIGLGVSAAGVALMKSGSTQAHR